MKGGGREKKKNRQTVSSSTIACGATRGAQQRVQLGREEASEQAAHAHAQRGGEPKSGADGAGEQHEEHLVRLLTERAQQHSFAVLKQSAELLRSCITSKGAAARLHRAAARRRHAGAAADEAVRSTAGTSTVTALEAHTSASTTVLG